MRALILIAMMIPMTAQAIVTKNCPDKINITVTNLKLEKLLNYSALDGEDDISSLYDGHNGLGILELQTFLRKIGMVKVSLNLASKGNARCEYKGIEEYDGGYASGVLYGSTRDGAVEPATLKYFFRGDFVGYVGIDKVSRGGLTFDKTSGLYYRGERCSWGDCAPDHIKVGSGNVVLK